MSERWERASEIVERVLGMPAGVRDDFLSHTCAGDPELEADVRALLAEREAAGGAPAAPRASLAEADDAPPIAASAEPAAAAAAPHEPPTEPTPKLQGSVIGPWRLLEPLGEGRLGASWLAEHAGEPAGRRGVLERFRLPLVSEGAKARFQRECRILAALEHPNIARLLDGGSTSAALPWLVTEHVEGVPLYAWCSAQALPVEERLRLFLAVCSAVHFAHRNLVVHLHLEPGNVRVTADGVPRLLGLGVAGIFGAERAAGTEAPPFTPLYSSPEQLRGAEPATSADIYSLGVLLYELLTGMHPFRPRTGATADMVRAVLETEPPRPSTAVTMRQREERPEAEAARAALPEPPMADVFALHRRLAGDLDSIVLQAMAREPARRYASAESLATDVQRHLDGRPIESRRDSLSYRLEKFAQRNRKAVASAALGAVALLAALGFSLYEGAIARNERALAERRLRDVQALANTLMFSVYDGVGSLPGGSEVRPQVLAQTARYLDALAVRAGRDTSLRFSVADAYDKLGTLQHAAGAAGAKRNFAGARSFARARNLREQLLREYPDSERALAGLVQSSTHIGEANEAIGRWSEAVRLMRQALQGNTRLADLKPGRAEYRAGLPQRHNDLGLALLFSGREADAAAELRLAVDGFAAQAAADTADWRKRRLLAGALTLYAQCAGAASGGESAEAVQRHALALYDTLSRLRPDDRDLESSVVDAHARLARISAFQTHQPDSAVAHVEIAQRMLETAAERDPTDRERALDVAAGRATQGLVLALAGRTDAASRLLRGVAPQLERRAREDSMDTRPQVGLPRVYLGLGVVELERARARGGRSASAWRTAQATLLRARAANERAAADPTTGAFPGEEARLIAAGLATCDSALAALPTRRR